MPKVRPISYAEFFRRRPRPLPPIAAPAVVEQLEPVVEHKVDTPAIEKTKRPKTKRTTKAAD